MTSRLPNLLGGAALLAAFAFGFANVATAQTITVNGCSSFTTAGGTSSNLTITCNTGVVGGPTAPSCNSNISAVGSPAASLTFTGNCTQGTNPITSVTLNGVSQCSGARVCEPLLANHTQHGGSGEHDQLHTHGFGWPTFRFFHSAVFCRWRHRRRRRHRHERLHCRGLRRSRSRRELSDCDKHQHWQWSQRGDTKGLVR